MSKKCCKSDPPCKDCPKLKKKKKHRKCDLQTLTAEARCPLSPFFTILPRV